MPNPTYQPGLEGIVAGETSVSTVLEGLHYRGYSVEDLALHCNYEEVAYLLLHGELPNAEELNAFQQRLIAAANSVPPNIIEIVRGLPAHGSMMDVMRTGCSLLAHYDPETESNEHAANVRKAERLLAQMPVLLAAAARARRGQAFVPAGKSPSLPENLLWMFTGKHPQPDFVRALDISYTLYAEHEFNASTFTGRVVASTLSDLHSGITAAIGALKGPLHGGANERVLEVMEQVGGPDNAETWIRNALANKVRVMGFGHRVYKHGDPRAVFLKTICVRIAEQTGNLPFEKTADVIERVMHEVKPTLPPNVDWPSARLYKYMGLPVEIFTPLFVVARIAGWAAHIIEQLDNNRLMRPSAIYTGPAPRTWKAISQR